MTRTECSDLGTHERRVHFNGFAIALRCEQCGCEVDVNDPGLDGPVIKGKLKTLVGAYEHLTDFVNHHQPACVVGYCRDSGDGTDYLIVESHFTSHGDHGMTHEIVRADITSVREFLGY